MTALERSDLQHGKHVAASKIAHKNSDTKIKNIEKV